MIGIINYGLGNIRAFANVYTRLNIPYKIVSNLDDLENVTKLILPGVGAFDQAMRMFTESGLKDTVQELVFDKKIPVLGICVGMQMLAKSSDEGDLPGLGWIDGTVRKFDVSLIKHRPHLPHMGWNEVKKIVDDDLFKDLSMGARFYFLHSYYFSCTETADVLAEAEYGIKFTCAVKRENIYGVQFHPEKSHQNGITVLKNFGSL